MANKLQTADEAKAATKAVRKNLDGILDDIADAVTAASANGLGVVRWVPPEWFRYDDYPGLGPALDGLGYGYSIGGDCTLLVEWVDA